VHLLLYSVAPRDRSGANSRPTPCAACERAQDAL